MLQQRVAEHAELNAFTHIPDALSEGDRGLPLSDKLVAIKDNIAVRDMPLTCASRILADYISPYDATAVAKLKEAGATIAGKTNLDEFAMGSSCEHSIHGPVRNPIDLERVAGGSSGGSAAAVAAGLVDIALGSDTGGSVRQPAAYCGVVGFKPTYGRVSRYGLVAFASSLDQIGIFANSIEDTAAVLSIISGFDENDATSLEIENPVPELDEADPSGFSVGIPEEYFQEGLDAEVEDHIGRVIAELESAGIKTQSIRLPHTAHAIAIYYIISSAEAASNLARYDGVRYGFRAEGSELAQMYTATREAGFGQEVKRRIMLGTFVLSAGYYDAYYAKAQKVRRLLRDDFMAAFQSVDALLTPTTPTTAFHLGEKLDDPLAMYLNDIYTSSANLAGIPAISIPAGRSKAGMPIGCQLMAAPFREETILSLGTIIERMDW